MSKRFSAQSEGLPEIESLRTSNSKTFEVSPTQRRLVASVWPLHVVKNGVHEEIDSAIADRGNGIYGALAVPYRLEFNANTFTLKYDDVTIRLMAGGLNLAGRQIDDETLRFNDLLPDFDWMLACRPYDIEIFAWLRSANAPHTFTYEITEPLSHDLKINFLDLNAHDNANRTGRPIVFPGPVPEGVEAPVRNRRRRCEITYVRSADDLSIPGFKRYTVTATITGRTEWRHPVTRIAEWRDNEIVYPVEIDPTVGPVSISVNADDGVESAGAYNIGSTINLCVDKGAFRFLNITVPQGSTIDSATFKFNITAADAPGTWTIYGEAIDDAAAWTHGQTSPRPTTAARTTESASQAVGSTGVKTVTVTTIIQAIVNRAGFASGNDIRILCPVYSGSNYIYWEDQSNTGTNEGKLTINYTAAGVSINSIPLIMSLKRSRAA